MESTELATQIMAKRLKRQKEDGNLESTEEMLRRVASTVASAGKLYGDSEEEIKKIEDLFYEIMDKQDFMPNSPTFTGAGTELGQLSACFVLPVEDSLDGIYGTLKDAAKIHQTGGGTGFSFSRLRPNGDNVKRSQGIASGPISFMKTYNASTDTIKQGGTRRGANMSILRVDHPDIMEFITCKEDLSQMTNFNISVAITNAFMLALETNSNYNLYNPKNDEVYGELNSREVWNKLVECAWRTGEPGIIFIDRINERNPNNHIEVIEATNP